jgi:malate dehydrogenase (oxaloacetate-decarboxylating)
MVLYARDIVEKDFLSLTVETTVTDASKAMKETNRGFAVIGSTDDPRGIITEWDIIRKVVAEGKDPEKVTVGDIMSTNLVYVEAGVGLAAVSQLMSDRGVRRLLVKDGNKVVGFITAKTMLARMNDYVDNVSAQISRLQAPWF